VSISNVVTIEQTSKTWKAMRLWSIGFWFFGLFALTAGWPILGLLLLLVGVLLVFWSRIGRWWTNG